MSITYALRFMLPLAMILPLSSHGQSLEDKVSQAKKMQAESQLGLDPTTVDSIIADKKAHPKAGANGKLAKPIKESAVLDSLIEAPTDAKNLAYDSDDATNADSYTRTPGSKKNLKANLPTRYEQRIFRNADRTLFSSTGGAAGRDYVLGPGDEVTVSLWGDKEKEYSLILSSEGKIFLEGIGQVTLAGENIDEAEKSLKERLSKVYSGINRGTTHVDVSLGKTGPIRIFVLGEVRSPGGYVFSGHTSVLSAMYFAKGPTNIGTVRNLQLTRSGNKFSLDLYKYLLKGENLSPLALQNGDILFAGRAEALVEIEGDVGRPAIYELKKGEGVKELLEFAGGINPTAAVHKLVLRRVFENGKLDYIDLATPQEYLSGKIKMELKDGDKIRLEKSTEISRNFLTISGPVNYPGSYEATGIRTVNQLVAKAGGLREDAFISRVHVVRFRPNGSSSLLSFSLDSTITDSIPLEPRDNVILYSVKDMYVPDSVEIAGAVFNPMKYEYRMGMTLQDLVMQSGGLLPHHEGGKAMIYRGTNREAIVQQITLNEDEEEQGVGNTFVLEPNDFVQIPVDPKWYVKEIVSLEGLFVHPGKYSLLYPGEPLASVISRAGGFKENAYVQGGRFYRTKDNVGRVGIDIARAVQKPRSKVNISLVSGDSIFIPGKMNTVKIVGEVGFETSVLVREGAPVQYYIDRAGGFTRRSEKDRVVVQFANGESSRDGYFNRKPDAGSVIYVPQGPEPVPVNWTTNINFILGTLTAGVTLIILANQVGK